METVTVEYNTYKFEELSEEAQEKALDTFRKSKGQYDSEFIFECVLDDWKEKLENLGMDDVKIQFSGFWSQGDGASFNANIDLKEFIKHANIDKKKYRHVLRLIEDEQIDAAIVNTNFANHYSHERTRYLSLETEIWSDSTPRLHKLVAELENELEEFRYDLAQDLYKALEQSWDYAMSKECLVEDIDANEYIFLDNGKLFG